MSEFIERVSDLNNNEIKDLLKTYSSVEDKVSNEKYLYDPIFWSLGSETDHDYMFDDLYFKSKNDKAKSLAISEGF